MKLGTFDEWLDDTATKTEMLKDLEEKWQSDNKQ